MKQRPFDLWKLYADIYEAEVGRGYGRMPRDFKDAKTWLELYPEFFDDMRLVQQFREAAQNFIRNGDTFARGKHFPLWLLLYQYNQWLPAKKKTTEMVAWETCNECGRSKLPGEQCNHERVKA